MPIQRIPRYKLLIAELIKHTPSNHPDFESLTKADTIVTTVAKHINEAVRSRENADKLLLIQNEFNGAGTDVLFVTPSRTFIRRGELIKKCRAGDKAYEFFLFNDLLVYASKSSTGRFNLHSILLF